MIRYIVKGQVRIDPAGDGRYGAARGDRTHEGIDYTVEPGCPVLSTTTGTVTKLGYVYDDDLSWRYVEVTDGSRHKHRLFYIEPQVEEGDQVTPGDVVGRAQDISRRYWGQGMVPHIHLEIRTLDGAAVNPEAMQ